MNKIINKTPLEWSELWKAMDKDPDLWVLTTEAMYWDMLGALPPQDMGANGFLVGEPNNHNAKGQPVYACFIKHLDSTCEARYMTQKQFNEWKAIRA